jgi:hypothetical protein
LYSETGSDDSAAKTAYLAARVRVIHAEATDPGSTKRNESESIMSAPSKHFLADAATRRVA